VSALSDAARERIRGIVAEHLCCKPAQVFDHSHLFDELGCDSLDVIEIGIAMEEEFDINAIPDDDVEKWRTVADIQASVAAAA